jgi:hypothetical protein
MEFPTSIANLFRPVQQTTAQQPNSGGSGAPSGSPTQGAPQKTGMEQVNSGADPANQNLDGANLGTGGEPKKPGSELDGFKDLFTIDPKKPQPKDPFSEPLLSLDPTKIAAAISKMEFAQQIPPELAQKALQGDVGSLQQILNHQGRSVYAAAFQAFTGIMENAFKKNNDRMSSSLGDKFRNFQISSTQSTNPVLNHPAVQPVLSSMRDLIARQDPNLHPTEVAKKAEDWFLSTNKALSALDEETAAASGTGGRGGPRNS